MKKVVKNKRIPKGNQKISDFFKITTSENRKIDHKTTPEKDVVPDSEEEFCFNQPSTSKGSGNDKENVSSISNNKNHCKKDHSPNGTGKKRKLDLDKIFVVEISPSKISPSTSECETKTDNFKNGKPVISVKSPEKLLSTQALKEFLTPKKQVLNFVENINIHSPKTMVENIATPQNSPLAKNKIGTVHISKTPRKLFHRSPNNVNEFNTHIIDSYVTITPSKCNVAKNTSDVIFVKSSSSSKKQSSILKYMSPSQSPASLQVQNKNETTPTRSAETLPSCRNTPNLISKVKTKLDFGDDNYFESDDVWDNLIENIPDFKLDLTESHHCKIVSVNPFVNKSILTLKSTKTGEQAVCNLEGFWVHSLLRIGDTVHVQAKKINDMEWVVNNDYGFLVFEPDLLISTTSVVNSVWCKRRSVLSEQFKGFERGNEAMLIGTLVHNVLQSALKYKMSKREELESYVKKLLSETNILRSLYECDKTVDHIEQEVCKFIPKIEEFLGLYITEFGTKSKRNLRKDNWKGSIISIEDIEENIWCPEFGLKGKVDISIKTNASMMPLEVKTGRATVSLEHRGQVIMYIMMMNKLGYNVPSGLLLYIREGILREIPITQKEKRDLMLLRNELTYYLTRKPKTCKNDNQNPTIYPPELPEPINHPGCQKCPYNILCTSFAMFNDENISSFSTLKNIQDEVLKTLSQLHLDYFMKWVSLLYLEADADSSSKNLREIFTLTPVQRENNGRCITYLKIVAVEECSDMFEHTFERKYNNSEDNFYSKGITEGNYVVVSTDNRPAVSSGFVTNITMISISVSLERNLNKKYPKDIFHVDSYDSNTIQAFNLTSLSLLLEMSSKSSVLRNIIVDKNIPTYKSTLPKSLGIKGKSILQRLNIIQQRAVLKAVASDDYFLIKGMPGTGKTSTIVALIQLLHELNKSILITSHTHSAVDNICLKLINYNISFLRLGSISRIDTRLIPYSEHHLTKLCSKPADFEKIYNNAQIIAVTCLGSGHPVLTKRTLDVCIVDESTQVLQCSLIRPLYAANTFILIGDPHQLPAIVKNRDALELGMSESLLERLYTEKNSVALSLNYRMNSAITALANDFTYNGELLIGSEDVRNATIHLPNKEVLNTLKDGSSWITEALDETLHNAIQIIDTGPIWKLEHKVVWKVSNCIITKKDGTIKEDSNVNIYEAAVVVVLVRTLLKAGVNPSDIGVIVTYRAQVAQLSNLLKTENVQVNTVDQFQGQDRSIIIFSCVRSKDISESNFVIDKYELLEDKKRINVAITRAKHKLIIIGDAETLNKYSTLKKILSFLKNKIIKLEECQGFSWESVLNI